MTKQGLFKVLKDNMDYIVNGADDIEFTQFRTGLIGLNYAISTNGFIPGGSIVQLVGESGVGKSTLALDIVANAQRHSNLRSVDIPFENADGEEELKPINAVYLDFERCYTPEYAASQGIDIDKVMVIRTPVAEQSYNIMEAMMLQGVQLFVIDSIASMVTQDENERSFDDTERMGSEAKLIKQVMKKFLVRAFDADALIIIINQYRSNISTMSRSDKKPFGTRSIHYNVRATIELLKIESIKDGVENVGAKIKAHVAKSRLGPAGKTLEFSLLYGHGYNYAEHHLTLASRYGIVGTSGKGWYTYNDIKVNGLKQAAAKLPMQEIEQRLQEVLSKGDKNESSEL